MNPKLKAYFEVRRAYDKAVYVWKYKSKQD